MPHITESDGQIELTERMSPGLRVFVLLVGLVPLIAPYELLIQPRWQAFSLLFALGRLVSAGAVAVGLAFVLIALLGLNQRLQFNARQKLIIYSHKTAVTPRRTKRYSFDDVEQIEINTHDWSDSPTTHGLQVTFKDGRRVEIGSFSHKNEAEQCLSRIENLMR